MFLNPLGGEALVNTTTTLNQYDPVITELAGGGYVIVWADNQGDDIRAQLFDADGTKVGTEIFVNDPEDGVYGQDLNPQVAALADGGFAVTWFTNQQPTTVEAQVFTAAGTRDGGLVSLATGGYLPQIASLTNGNFVVTWQIGNFETQVGAQLVSADGSKIGSPIIVADPVSDSARSAEPVALPGGGFAVVWDHFDEGKIYIQAFSAAGAETTGEVQVNTTVRGANSSFPQVTALDNGNLLVTWYEDNPESGIPDLFGQLLSSGIQKIGPELTIATEIEGAVEPLALPGGGFVVAWVDLIGGDEIVKAQMFAADGSRAGSEITVSGVNSDVNLGDIEALPDGNFAIVWDDARTTGPDTSSSGVWLRVFDPSGAAIGDETLVNTAVTSTQWSPVLGTQGDGRFVVAWNDISGHVSGTGPDTSGDAVKAQFYRLGASGTSGNDAYAGTEGDDLFFGLGGNENSLYGLGGNDRLYGGIGDDTILGGDGDDRLFGGEGRDSVWGGTGNDYLDGGGAPDNPYGVGDSLYGEGGDDILVGSNTSMVGGQGNDTYYAGRNAVVYEQSGQGYDVVYLTAQTLFTLGVNEEVELLAVQDGVEYGVGITGSDYGQRIVGGVGSDDLKGRGGDDVLEGGAGVDVMDGGAGSDTFYVDNAGDVVIDAVAAGVDRVATSTSYNLAAAADIEVFEVLDSTSITDLDLGGNDFGQTMVGNAGNNVINGGGGPDTLVGLAGDDTLIGSPGDDTMHGGTGNDVYFVDAAGDVVYETAGEGSDRVATTVSYTLLASSSVEILETGQLSGTTAINLTGSTFAQQIIGNSGDNVITGGGGNDWLIGYGGNDTLIGTSSANTLEGGTGNDVYFVFDAADYIFERSGEGNDRVAVATSYTLAAAAEVETLETNSLAGTGAFNLIGNAFVQTVIGNAGANVLDGKGGADVLIGGAGADTFAFTSAPGGSNVDALADFVSGTDRIALDAAFFAIQDGALAAGAFYVGSQAADGDDRVIYNQATGALYYDPDGTGATAQVQFATVWGNPPLAGTDFFMVNLAGEGAWDY